MKATGYIFDRYHETGDTIYADRIVRPNKSHITQENPAKDASKIQKIGYQAYLNSPWLKTLAKQSGFNDEYVSSLAFDPNDTDKLKVQEKRVKQSIKLGSKVMYWIVHRHEWESSEADEVILPGEVPRYQNIGFVKLEQQGYNRNPAKHLIQAVTKHGVYACLHDINIVPGHQRKGLATALAYAALSSQPLDMPSSLYTAYSNIAMRNWAVKYGYTLTDSYDDNTLFNGLSVASIRYEAPTVGLVLARMAKNNEWLRNSVAYSC